jgi:hypothetical protein
MDVLISVAMRRSLMPGADKWRSTIPDLVPTRNLRLMLLLLSAYWHPAAQSEVE